MAVNGGNSDADLLHPAKSRDVGTVADRNDRLASQAGDLLSHPASRTAFENTRLAQNVPLNDSITSLRSLASTSGLPTDTAPGPYRIDRNQEAALSELSKAMGISPNDFLLRKHFTAGGDAQPGAERQKSPYELAHEQYQKQADAWWKHADEIKHSKGKITDFPPVYNGPPNPKGPDAKEPSNLPNLREIVDGSKNLSRLAYGDPSKPDFKIDDLGEQAFKKRYAEEAVRVGQDHGITKDGMRDIVRGVYAFEDGGRGTHDLLSGTPDNLFNADKTAEKNEYRPASTAIGYTQVLMMSTLGRIGNEGDKIAARLNQMAKDDPAHATQLQQKADMLTHLKTTLDTEVKEYAEARNAKLPDGEKKQYFDAAGKAKESLYSDFAGDKEYKTSTGLTGREFATAVHGLNLDADIGPMIQIRQLAEDIGFAQKQGFLQKLEVKAQNWTAQANAYDCLPQDQKAKAVAEVMGAIKPSASDANSPVKKAEFEAARTSLSAKLLDMKPGSADGLTKNKLTGPEYDIVNNQVLKLNQAGDGTFTLSQNAELMLSKLAVSHFNGITAAKLMPAAIELSNLAGSGSAARMLGDDGALPSVNFFQRLGYERNPTVNRRTGDELLFQIFRNMNGPNSDLAKRPEQGRFMQAFEDARVPSHSKSENVEPSPKPIAPPGQRSTIPPLLRKNNDATLRDVNDGPPQPKSPVPEWTLRS